MVPVGRLSIRACLTLTTAALAVAGLALVGVVADVLLRRSIEQGVFADTQRAATVWIGSMRQARPPAPITGSEVDLLQLVDPAGRVVTASEAAAGRPRMSNLWPPKEDRIQHRTECPAGGECVMFTANRVSQQEADQLWGGRPHVVYAGQARPPILATNRLELMMAGGVLAGAALAGWMAWTLVGRALRPVDAVRARVSEITVTDLGLRLPEPPGHDAFARLVRTLNQTLSHLQEAVEQQRNFASMVSHELRTPLTGLRASVEEALLYPEVDARETLHEVLQAAERFQTIINEMLMLTKVRTSSPHDVQPIDVGALIREEVARRGRDIPIHVRVDDEVTVRGNAVQLTEVLTNLLLNAQRHAHSRVEVTVGRDEALALVTVCDDGEGISPGDRDRVFQPFVRLSESRERDPGGSGLGLPISRAIVQAHFGTLRIEDSPRGACFVIRLPLIRP
ncbi:sensor histidine kinase [Nonomuraea rubra]